MCPMEVVIHHWPSHARQDRAGKGTARYWQRQVLALARQGKLGKALARQGRAEQGQDKRLARQGRTRQCKARYDSAR